MQNANDVDAIDILEIRRISGGDIRSIQKRLRGEQVRGVAGARIDRAIRQVRQGRGQEPNHAA